MRKVLIIGKYYFPFQGGIEVNTRDVAEHLAKEYEVCAIVSNHAEGDAEEFINGVRVIRCATPYIFKSQPISPSMYRYIRETDADVIHFHAPNFFAIPPLLLKLAFAKKHTRLIITHHMDVFGRALLRAALIPLYRLLVSRASAVIVTSAKNADLSKDLPATAPLAPIPLGIGLEDYALTDEQRAAAMVWRKAIAGNAPTVGFVGRHARYKGLDVLAKAIKQLPEVHAFIAGDGPYQQAAIKLAHELGIEKRVHFLGNTSHADKLRMLAASDVFAFPSTEITEAFGVSQLEAMATGTPVVASNLPTGVTDVAIDGKTALLVPPGDAAALASKIRRLLDDRDLAKRLVAGALDHIRSNLAREVVLSKTEALFDRVLSGDSWPDRGLRDVAIPSQSPVASLSREGVPHLG